ncbi:hypothetical protein [Umezakia ovalisporum]|uniref:hypothetical protein n=1 Tax=Umezakia ovalisporum TaxID=75695 RepID=UPI000A9711B8
MLITKKIKNGLFHYLRRYHQELVRHTIPLWKYRFSQESRNWKRLKNQYQGQRCFILGNGPSLKQQDLTLLKNEITFVTNWFVLHPEIEEINPNYYCICAHEIFGTKSDQYIQWNREVNFEQKLYDLLQRKAKNSVKVFPFYFKKGIKQKGFFKDDTLMYLFFEPPAKALHEVGYMNLDIAKERLNSGETVIINFCLPIAYYLGFKQVYLIGCDCDYGMKKSDDPRSYFYNAKDQSGAAPSFEWLQRSWSSDGPMIQSYAVARQEFEKRGRKIYNATAGGKLEVFPRVNYENLFEKG